MPVKDVICEWWVWALLFALAMFPLRAEAGHGYAKPPAGERPIVVSLTDRGEGKAPLHRQEVAARLSMKEKEWFDKFYSGVFVFEGWREIAESILSHYPRQERQEKDQFIEQLGLKIGSEWCRDNDVRKIDTAMLKNWGERLRTAAQRDTEQLTLVLEAIDGEVDRILDQQFD